MNGCNHLMLGNCDFGCYDMDLLYDGGDCIQLCLAEGVTGCTLELLQNDVCDPNCHNNYCVAYPFDSNFEVPSVRLINNTYYAADFYQCPYNMSSALSVAEMYPNCTESAAYSVYIDQNVPSGKYSICDPSWINDGSVSSVLDWLSDLHLTGS